MKGGKRQLDNKAAAGTFIPVDVHSLVSMKRRDFLKLAAASAGVVCWPALAAPPESSFPIRRLRDRIIVLPDRAGGIRQERRSLQEAIDLATAAGAGLEILPGVYRTKGLIIEGPLVVRGTPGQTVIEPAGLEAPKLDIRPKASGERLSGVRLSGLVFDGKLMPHANEGDTAERPIDPLPLGLEHFTGLVTAVRVDDLMIEDCEFGGASAAALALWECRAANISRNWIASSRVALFSYAGRGNVFGENRFADSVEFGSYVAHHG
jgi:hypothetical protein